MEVQQQLISNSAMLTNDEIDDLYDSMIDVQPAVAKKSTDCDCEFISYGGSIVCKKCGSESGLSIDHGSDLKYNQNDKTCNDQARCGFIANPLLIESSYSTSIKCNGNNMLYNKLKQFNICQIPHHEKSLKNVFDILTKYGEMGGLPQNIITFSHQLYGEVSKLQVENGKKKSSRGEFRKGVMGACLFYSCKEYNNPRSPTEIAKMCELDICNITRGIDAFFYLMQQSELININKAEYVTQYVHFIDRFCNKIGILDSVKIDDIKKIANKIKDLQILSKNTPQAHACGAIYFVSNIYNLGITKIEIGEKCKISVPTLTKVYEKLIEHTDSLI
jgi:transcription initiation factor TFIIIB Brf1 subunit/transcription initiation factor TFIIB